MFHQPVMVDEVLGFLRPGSGTIVDGTVGGGGHARALLERGAAGPADGQAAGAPGRSPFRLLGIDADGEAIAEARRQLEDFENVELVHSTYAEMAALVRRLELAPVTGVLLDLGVSLHQLQSAGRGFGHDVAGPLDMRFDQESGRTAADVVRVTPERELRDLLREFGEEPMSGRVARVIHELRAELRTTADLARAVGRAVPARFRRKALARTFQAIRIAVNRELENVRQGIAAALDTLAPGGRLVVISYHSLEDRLAKQAFRQAAAEGRATVLTPKPLRPTEEEVARNPRARSARLRAVEVTG